MTPLTIACECYVDSRLIEILTRFSKVNHQQGKSNVASTMLKNKVRDGKAIGLIDEDRGKGRNPGYFEEFTLMEDTEGLQRFRHPGLPHFLVKICPAVERWLLTAAAEVELKPEQYGLSSVLQELGSITKKEAIADNVQFKRFVRDLVQLQSPRIVLLQQWLAEFIEGAEIGRV